MRLWLAAAGKDRPFLLPAFCPWCSAHLLENHLVHATTENKPSKNKVKSGQEEFSASLMKNKRLIAGWSKHQSRCKGGPHDPALSVAASCYCQSACQTAPTEIAAVPLKQGEITLKHGSSLEMEYEIDPGGYSTTKKLLVILGSLILGIIFLCS